MVRSRESSFFIPVTGIAIGLASLAIGKQTVHYSESERLAYAHLTQEQQFNTAPPQDRIKEGDTEITMGVVLLASGLVGGVAKIADRKLKTDRITDESPSEEPL